MALKFHTHVIRHNYTTAETSRLLQNAAAKIRAGDHAPVAAVRTALKAAERGADDDVRTIIADLISNDASPFTPDDMDSLLALTPETLVTVAERFLSKRVKAREEEPAERDTAIEEGRVPKAANRRMTEAERREAEAFMPESSLVVAARMRGQDTAPILARLAERAERARSAFNNATRYPSRPAGAIALNAAEQKRAEDFAPESSLSAWRKSRTAATGSR